MEGFEGWLLGKDEDWIGNLDGDELMEASEVVERLRAHIDRKDAEISLELRRRARLRLADEAIF